MKAIYIILIICIILSSCTQQTTSNEVQMGGKKMKIKSSSFENGQDIPKRYTCQAEDINPRLMFENLPNNTETLVLIVDDPDAPGGTWDHWILFNIPPIETLKEDMVPSAATEGKNSWGNNEYGGPCPPSRHRYFFKLYALDTTLSLNEGASKEEVNSAMQGHIIESAELMGYYEKN